MTHDDLIAALFPAGAPSDYKAHALILPLTTVTAINAAQEAIAATRHRVQPVATTDGRWLVAADILPELAPGGLFEAALPHFDAAALGGVEVLPWSEAVALLPVSVDL